MVDRKRQRNLWGISPWNALLAATQEKSKEMDIWYAGHARALLERAQQDNIAMGWGCNMDFAYVRSGMDEAPYVTGAWFILTVDVETQFIAFLDGSRRLFHKVRTLAPNWIHGHYPCEDGVIKPRDVATMAFIVDRDMHYEDKPAEREVVRFYLETILALDRDGD